MGKIRFKCGCDKILVVDEQHAGKVTKCPGCGRPVKIPETDTKATPTSRVDFGKEIQQLSSEFGTARERRERNKRFDATLRELNKRRLRRNLIISGIAIVLLITGFGIYRMTRTIGPHIGALDSYPEQVREFLHGLNSEEPTVRAAATWEVADGGGVAVSGLIARMTEDSDRLVQIVALNALGRTRAEDAPAQFERCLKDSSLDVRMRAAFLLARRADNPPSRKTLASFAERAMEGDETWVVWLQDIAAGRDVSGEQIAKAIASKNVARVKQAAWMSAVAFGANSELLNILRSNEPEAVMSSILAVSEFVTRGYFESRNDRAGHKRDCVTTLNHISLRLRHEDVNVRRLAAVAMSEHGQPDLLFMHQQGLKDPDWFVRFASLKALVALDPRQVSIMIRTTEGMPAYEQNPWVKRLLDEIGKRAAKTAEARK